MFLHTNVENALVVNFNFKKQLHYSTPLPFHTYHIVFHSSDALATTQFEVAILDIKSKL